MFETLSVEVDGSLGRMTLARPEKLNPLSTKRHVNAVTDQMVGTMRSWSDADGLVTALGDSECGEARRRYLRARRT